MASPDIIRIGTRKSELALWQARKVKDLLHATGINATLVPVHSEGDIDLITPLYAMGVQGVFTKTLDAYLLSNKIDIAVHSMKDVPTQLALGLRQAAVLPRGDFEDVLVIKKGREEKVKQSLADDTASRASLTIGTGSVRRKAQWLHRYPADTLENLRGNVQTRLRKLDENEHWDAAIFARAGLERMHLLPDNALILDWMLPAPAQGAIMVVARERDENTLQILQALNDAPTALCTAIERDFLKTLMGGCSTPISAHAVMKHPDQVSFKGGIVSPNGGHHLFIEATMPEENAGSLGKNCADKLLVQGADKIVAEIRAHAAG